MREEKFFLDDERSIATTAWGESNDAKSGHTLHRSFFSELSLSLSTWRGTTLAGVIIASLVFLINLIFLIWASTINTGTAHPTSSADGLTIFYTGDCTSAKTISTVLHLVINVLSALLLGASSHCMQALSSPTREDVDKAHQRKQWVSIGLFSLRNFSSIPIRRTLICCLLALSSIPLAFFYNAVITTLLISNSWVAVPVYDSIFQIGPHIFNDTGISYVNPETWIPSIFNLTQYILMHNVTNPPVFEPNYPPQPLNASYTYYTPTQSDMDLSGELYLSPAGTAWMELSLFSNQHGGFINLTAISTSDCVKAYSNNLISKYRNVLLVIQGNNHTQNVVVNSSYTSTGFETAADQLVASSLFNSTVYNYYPQITDPIDHCQVEEVPETCQLGLSRTLMGAVLICNSIKIICMLFALLSLSFQPLVTFGDALDSLLSRQDKYTRNQSTLSAKDVKNGLWLFGREEERTGKRVWAQRNSYWAQGASFWRWLAVMLIGGATLFTSVGLIKDAIVEGNYTFAPSTLGLVQNSQIISGLPSSMSPAYTALVANIFQVMISLTYLLYNGILSSMVLIHEYSSYERERKGLRVSRPRLNQRASWFLSLPFRFSVPLMLMMIVLHWLTSEAVFSIYVTSYDIFGNISVITSIVGYSSTAMVFAVIAGGILLLALPLMGLRKYRPGFVIAANCSAALSAACHPPATSTECDVGAQKLRYGVFVEPEPEPGSCDTADNEYDLHCCQELRRVGFSSEDVEPLVPGDIYEGPYTIPKPSPFENIVFEIQYRFEIITDRAPFYFRNWREQSRNTLKKLI